MYRAMLQLPAPMRDPRVLRTLLLLDLESHPPAAAIDIVTIEVDPAPGRVVQYSLLERALPSPETLATLTARLGALVGETRCGSPELLDTHRPDGFGSLAPVGVRRPACGAIEWQPATARPRIDAVVHGAAPVPAAGGGSRDGRARPARSRGHRSPRHAGRDRRSKRRPVANVRRLVGNPLRWDRDEWDVALDDGAVCRLFQDRDTGQWFVEGVYD